MDLSYEKVAALLDLIAAPAAIVAALPVYVDWARKIPGRPYIQAVLIAIAVAGLSLDAVDRLGVVWPSPAQNATALEKTRETVDRQARKLEEMQATIDRQAKTIDQLLSEASKSPTGPKVVTSRKECPPGYSIFYGADIRSGHTGMWMTEGARVCMVDATIRGERGPALEVAPAPKKP